MPHAPVPGRASDERGDSALGTALVYALVVVVFGIDMLTNVGFAAGMLYVPAVLLSYFLTSARHVPLVAAIAAVLTVLGGLLSPPLPALAPAYVVGNRAVSVVAILACGWFGWAILSQREHLEAANRELSGARDKVGVQTRLLEIAGEVGRFGGWSIDVLRDRAHWSDEVSRIHGIEPGSTHTVAEGIAYYVPEDQPRVSEAFEACVRRGTSIDLELQIRRADGELRWVNVVGRAERDADGRVVVVHGAMQDITDRIDAQLDAASNRRALEVLSECMPFIIWTATPSGEIDYVSEELWRFAGILTQDALGEAWLDLVHPDDREPSLACWAESLASGEPYSTSFRLRRRDGGYRWHLVRATAETDHGGAVVKWWGSATDIHDVHMLEARATELAGRLTDTLESIGDAVLALDATWRVTFVNSHAERLLQGSRTELDGRVIWDVFPEARGTVFQEQYERAVRERRPTRFDAPFEPLGIHAEISAYPHEHGLTIYFRDVSEQRELAARLARAQRLEAVGLVTGGIAHDFGELLGEIRRSADELTSRLGDPELHRLAENITTTAERGADLTGTLRAFSLRQPAAQEPVDVDQLLRDL